MIKDDLLTEARDHIERAASYIDTLHLGPLDYNIAQAIDGLLAAQRCLERFRDKPFKNA